MKINEYFENIYLTAGKTTDNFIFENCPNEFLMLAQQKLTESANNVKPCCVTLTKETETTVEAVLNCCEQEFQKKLLARDFITSLVMEKVLQDIGQEREFYSQNQQVLQAFMLRDYEMAKSLHVQSFMPHQVAQTSKKYGKIELDFFLNNTSNIYIQQAINLFVSCREPYTVKILTNNKRLPTYYDLNGMLIECPHDFMRRDVNQFIDNEIAEEKES